ncbi:MAG TPA: hypothetical protein DCW68_03520 [Rhodospirillaceae bacterium]|nr:MAG: hypothetical protein A2018_07600 [Alphaproteobacteria bacterium GWF2_58_20]HAU29163.1 hypothetical protein [Rhodospirillaceae bacterium]
MKFLVFNLAVIAALAYLVMAHGPGFPGLVQTAQEAVAAVQPSMPAGETAAKRENDSPMPEQDAEGEASGSRMARLEEAMASLARTQQELAVAMEKLARLPEAASFPVEMPARVADMPPPALAGADVENPETSMAESLPVGLDLSGPRSLLPSSAQLSPPALPMLMDALPVSPVVVADDMDFGFADKEDAPGLSVRDRQVALGAMAEDMEMLYARKLGE